jgi:ATP-dependent Lhr-like helicase
VQRRDLGWLLAAVRGGAALESPTSDGSAAVLEVLSRRGALFLDDLSVATRLSRDQMIAALWDLVGRGLVTADGFGPLRELLSAGRSPRGRRGSAQGRWSLFDGGEPFVDAPLGDEIADRVAEQLLVRYGVVFREVAARESFAVPWRDVARALRRREARGLVRGGRFVAGFMGEQYALPEAVEGLRRIRRTERNGDVVRICAADPLNLVGILTPGPRVPSNQGPPLVFVDGAFTQGERAEDTPSGSGPGLSLRPIAV